MTTPVRNPFRERGMRLAFDELLSAYGRRSKLLFHEGNPTRGNSAAIMFWRGYEGAHVGTWDRASKETAAYAHWRAGRAVRTQEDRDEVK